MTEAFGLGTAQDREDLHRERCQRVDALRGELEGLDDGLPTFVADVGADTLDRLVDVMIADRSFTDKQVGAVHQLAVQQERVERVEQELEALDV